VATSGLTAVRIVPLDRIQMPATDEVADPEEMIGEALKKRPEMEQAQLNLQSNEMNLAGIKNSLRPTLQAFAEVTNNGLTGQLTALGLLEPGIGYLGGGYGNLLSEIARRNYPNYSAGFSFNVPLRNRAAQADYATSLLEVRQNQLNLRKNVNQIRVDVENALVGLKQARARYEAAARSRVLQEQTLAGDQKRYSLGATTPFQVVQDQRDLATAQSAEVQSMANYTHARIALEQALGTTLDVHHISIQEALQGQVTEISSIPPEVPNGGRP